MQYYPNVVCTHLFEWILILYKSNLFFKHYVFLYYIWRSLVYVISVIIILCSYVQIIFIIYYIVYFTVLLGLQT